MGQNQPTPGPDQDVIIARTFEPLVARSEDAGFSAYVFAIREPSERWAAYVACRSLSPDQQQVPGLDGRSGTLVQGVFELREPEDTQHPAIPVVYEKFIDSALDVLGARVRFARWRASSKVVDLLKGSEARDEALFIGLMSPLPGALQTP